MAINEGMGDDIFVSDTDGDFIMDGVQINNPGAVQSIRAEYVNVSMNKVSMKVASSV